MGVISPIVYGLSRYTQQKIQACAMPLRKFRLRTLLITLSVGGIVFTSCVLLGALLLFQKSNIESSLLESNIAYARKLAETTDLYLATAQRELAWSATQIRRLDDANLLSEETERLRLQSGFFNSVVVVDHNAVITAISPDSLNMVGVKVYSEVSRRAISTQKPFISAPYTSVSGNYVVFISQPLLASDGHYLGYIGGTIYLKKQSMLSNILSQHFYGKSATVSIVSNDGLIIFSHDPARVGERMKLNAQLLKQVATTETGRFSEKSGGKVLLTGYASMHVTDWNIFIAGTSETVESILMRTVLNACWFLLGIIILTAAVMALLAGRVASPLEKLADRVRDGGSDAQAASLESINGWYYEADRLKEAVQQHRHAVAGRLAVLHDEAMTDPLTGLLNRRGFYTLIEKWEREQPLCVVAIDIDHFKKVNDWYGHDAGDAVLVQIASLLRDAGRSGDVISRFGGEEFILLLPFTALDAAARIAERMRKAVMATTFSYAGEITVSAGVASFEGHEEIDVVLRRADEALYEAKHAGRNKVIMATSAGFISYSAAQWS